MAIILFWDGSATRNLGASDALGKTTGIQKLAHKFTPSADAATGVVELSLAKTGSPSDNVNVSIYADGGGSSGPTGSALATAVLAAGSAVTTSAAQYTSATITYSFVSGTPYWAVAERSGSQDDANYYYNVLSTPGNFGTHWAYYSAAWHDYTSQFQGSITLNSASASPSVSPSVSLSPSLSPSISPSISPSASPSKSPSTSPSVSPSSSLSPSLSPSASPSQSPSVSPSVSPSPSLSPSASPSKSPSISPSASPSKSPSISPSVSPSASLSPSVSPSVSPSPAQSLIDYLVVGGGGVGGATDNSSHRGGGGGGGGQVATGSVNGYPQAYSIVVGASGASSSALGVTATAGGAGGLENTNGSNGASGGGAGGRGPNGGNGTNTGGTGSPGGNGGSSSTTVNGDITPPGGGGGASGVGGDGDKNTGEAGDGGAGTASSISGASVNYGGGGGGGAISGFGTGTDGGGNGGNAAAGAAGTANRGGGGGGAGTGTFSGGAGGTGIVILSAPIGHVTNPTLCGGTHTTSGGNDIWTYTTSGTWTPAFQTLTAAMMTMTLTFQTVLLTAARYLSAAYFTMTLTFFPALLKRARAFINSAMHSATLTNKTKAGDLLTNGGFAGNATGWTLGSGWAYANGKVTHTSGTAVLSQSVSTTINTAESLWRMTVLISGRTAGSVAVSLGGGGGGFSAFSTNGVNFDDYGGGEFGTDHIFTLTPTNDFDGSIEDVSIVSVPTFTNQSGHAASLTNQNT